MARSALAPLVAAGSAGVALLAFEPRLADAARLVGAGLLVVVLPGFAVSVALAPGRALGLAERAAIGLGVSFALAVLGGLGLHWTPWGLHPTPWALVLGMATVGGSTAAIARRGVASLAPWRSGERPGLGEMLMLGAAASLALGAVSTAWVGAVEQPATPFTQLWLTPARRDGAPMLRLGIRSAEPGPSSYRLELLVGGRPADEWPTIELQAGEAWEMEVDPRGTGAGSAQVEVVLYRGDDLTTVYRRVTWWPGEPRPVRDGHADLARQ